MSLPDIDPTPDPENGNELRDLGHSVIDDVVDYLQGMGELPVHWLQ